MAKTELDEFAEWMNEGNHDPQIVHDYGGPTIECSNQKCLASKYDWISAHVEEFRRDQKEDLK